MSSNNNNNNGNDSHIDLIDKLGDAIYDNNFELVDTIVEENGELVDADYSTLENIQSTEMIDHLLSLGFSLSLENDSLLAQFIRLKRADLAQHLLTKDGVDVNAFNIQGHTPLIEATIRQDMDMMGRLVAKGADMNRGTKEIFSILGGVLNNMEVGYTPLHFASCITPDLVQWLLARGANMNIENAMGRFPIHRAAFCNKLDILQLYLSRGVPVDIRGTSNYTPLSDTNGDIRTIEFLLEHGADINGTFGPFSNTLLTKAAEDNDAELVRYLMRKRGIDVYAKRPSYPGHGGITALEIALHRRNHRVVEILVALAPESARPSFYNTMSERFTANHIAVVAGANAGNRRKPALLARARHQKAQREAYEALLREQGAVGGGSAAAGAVPVPAVAAVPVAAGKTNAAPRKRTTRRKRRSYRKQRK